MEARKITIILSDTNSRKEIMSGAENLGDLKTDLRQHGINYSDKTFYEGRSRTELKDDSSILPTNVPLANKGTTTNELVFMLTTPNKKIKSGAMTRPEVYAAIKAQGLQEAVKEKFGKNFTQVSTADLEAMLGQSKAAPSTKSAPKARKAKKVETTTEEVAPKEADIVPVGTVDIEARQLLSDLLNKLEEEYELAEDYSELKNRATMLVHDSGVAVPESTESKSSDDVDDIDWSFTGRN